MKTIRLYRPVVGKCINVHNFGPARIASVDAAGYAALQGGVGVYECVIIPIPDEVLKQANLIRRELTDDELAMCERIMNDAEE